MSFLTKTKEHVKKAREDWHKVQVEQEKKEVKRLEKKLARTLAKAEKELDIEEQKERQAQLKKEIRYAKGIKLTTRRKPSKHVKKMKPERLKAVKKPKAQVIYVTTQPVRSTVKRKTTTKRKKTGRRTRTARKPLRGVQKFIGRFGYND